MLTAHSIKPVNEAKEVGGDMILRMAYYADAHRWEISVTNTYLFPPAIGS